MAKKLLIIKYDKEDGMEEAAVISKVINKIDWLEVLFLRKSLDVTLLEDEVNR